LNGHIDLSSLDLTVFALYLALAVLVGFLAGRTAKRRDAKDYFLGDKQLPWYVVGVSMVATVVSTEQFIAQVGAGYSQGIVIAAFGWNAWIVYTLLIWVFLPYYVRTGLFTMPEFLERRYSPACRYTFACFLVLGYIVSIIAGSLFAAGVALENMFGLNIIWGIFILGILTGGYTIYGGLRSAAWSDFMQMGVLLGGGIMVPILGLAKIGGIAQLFHDAPEKFQLFHGVQHPLFPFTGVFTSFLSVGIWYNCTSQHIVQRCLAAKDEWNARMGVVGAGFLQIITPSLFVLPGIIAYRLFPHLDRPDSAYLMLVRTLIPSGLRGLILAAMAAALMSSLSSMINSTSTLLTMDIYKRAVKPDAGEREMVAFGRWSGFVVLVISMIVALYYSNLKGSFLFILVQEGFAYIAPPFAVIFTAGFLWRRATAKAALTTIALGFPFTLLVQFVLFPYVEFLRPYANYLHRALISWCFCVIVMVVTSLLTAPPDPERVKGIIWNRRYALLPPEEQARHSGWQDFRIWWLIFITIVLAIYGSFLRYRFLHPDIP
jgi:SSS family solute:Na+ symporter